MRKFASFSFSCPLTPENKEERINAVRAAVRNWLHFKGAPDQGGRFALKGGEAELVHSTTSSSVGETHHYSITEPVDDGRFKTDIAFAVGQDRLSIHAVLAGGSDQMAPTYFDARRPYAVRDILKLPYGWTYRNNPVKGTPCTLRGHEGGAELVRMIWSDHRRVPVIVISEESNGAMLHPELPAHMADDLVSLAIVIRIDAIASWHLTQTKGKVWSCYNGAIRLYWPGELSDPMRHPLWSAYRLMEGATSADHAASRIRNQLRRTIFSQSALAVWEPRLFSEVRHAFRHEQVKEQLKKARSAEEFEELAEGYAKEASDLRVENKRIEREVNELKAQLEQLNIALRHQQMGDDAIAPDDYGQPRTVKEAVDRSRKQFSNDLIFGKDIDRGVATLLEDAGPPEKIQDYLEALAAMTKAMREGELGKSIWLWLRGQGVNGSDEEPAARKQKTHRRNRTWDNGSGAQVYFDKHLKPTDATSPDRCVRIYFEYDKDQGRTIVGWIGRHPD